MVTTSSRSSTRAATTVVAKALGPMIRRCLFCFIDLAQFCFSGNRKGLVPPTYTMKRSATSTRSRHCATTSRALCRYIGHSLTALARQTQKARCDSGRSIASWCNS